MEVARTNLSFSSSGEAHTTVILPPALDAQDTAEMVQHAPRMSPQLPVLNSSRPCLNSTSRGCEIKQDSSHKHPKKETNYYYCNPLATCNELLAGEAVEREHNAITGEQGCRYTQLVRTVFLDAMNQSTKKSETLHRLRSLRIFVEKIGTTFHLSPPAGTRPPRASDNSVENTP